jgi:acetyl-CoA carboxylase carboxyl transferase subunit alpha
MSEQATGSIPEAQAVSPAWVRIERARHPQRPYPMDFIERIFTDFSEIHGDRAYGDDEAVACGMARLGADEVLVIGNRKGGSTKERGQAEAIARNIRELARLRVPTISVISGEGGSGGALALAVSDRVLILENALYFVITPESCAAIMWRDANQKQLAAEAMRISAPEVRAIGCVDEIIGEPDGGAHTDREAGAGTLGMALKKHLAELKAMPVDAMVAARQEKFRKIAQFYTEG